MIEAKVIIGSKVKIFEERHAGKTGTVTSVYPAGAYAPEELYRIRYDNSYNSGMFKSSEFEIIEDGVKRRFGRYPWGSKENNYGL